ncbi:hypothetical protein CcaCcLH18_05219 [Colletotrichum camelliae]|nr:hypothetical protein CcaCcLH18_05219 [Colletotrichum camelliae]
MTVTEFILLSFKHPSSSPSAAWADVTSSLKSVPGVTSLFTGPQLEDPSRHLLVINWASPEAFSAFASSESYTPWFASLKAITATDPAPVFYKAPLVSVSGAGDDDDQQGQEKALRAPCTEVFVAYGVEPDFIGKTAAFAGGLSAAEIAGFHGHAYGEVSTPLAFGAEGEKGPAVTLLLGWDSKEAHLEAKGKAGPISDNIHLLRSGRKEIAMFHVNLKQI